MKLPRDISVVELTNKLSRVGYRITRQTGSHIRLTTEKEGSPFLPINHFELAHYHR